MPPPPGREGSNSSRAGVEPVEVPPVPEEGEFRELRAACSSGMIARLARGMESGTGALGFRSTGEVCKRKMQKQNLQIHVQFHW